jgi:hypothetical protein
MSSSDLDERLIPDRLAECAQWICWQEVERDGKPTKVPIKPYHTSGTANASATDPATWRDLQSALEFHQSDRVDTDGIGFVFAPETSLVGVDLDDCRDPATGDLTDWARDIVERLDSYTEVSPSGRGVHVLLDGELPPGRNRRGAVEMYDEARFFTVTTNHVEGTPETVARRQDALLGVHYEYVQTSPDSDTAAVDLDQAVGAAAAAEDETPDGDSTGDEPDEAPGDGTAHALGSNSSLYARYGVDVPDIEDPALEVALHSCSVAALPDDPPTTLDAIAGPGVELDDDALLERAMASKRGDTIAALYAGDRELWASPESRYPSQSEADMGLCFYLGFWTGGDPDRIDRLFRASGLYRGKWDRVHFANGATYGAVCIARTLLQVTDYYSPPDRSFEPDDSVPTPAHSGGDSALEPSPTTAALANDQAVEDAKRLASKVQRQQRELHAQRERLDVLERRLQWYRQVLGVQSKPDAPDGDDYDVEDALRSTTDGRESELRAAQRSSASPHADSVAPSPQTEFGHDSEDDGETADASSESDAASTPQSGFLNQLRRWL